MNNHIDYVLFSVDPVILSIVDDELSVLAITRDQEPYKGKWALPGGRVDKDACSLLAPAVALKLKEKTGIEDMFFEQVQTYGGAEMDPRGWSVTTSYLALTHESPVDLSGVPSGATMAWLPVSKIASDYDMAFWHAEIIHDAVERLRSKSYYSDLPVNLMPETFTFQQLRKAYELILGIRISRQSFQKRMDDAGIFEDTGERERGSNRPSPLYRKKTLGGSYFFPRMIKG